MKNSVIKLSLLALLATSVVQAQDTVTNAFDDLNRKGTLSEDDSEMRKIASSEALNKLLQEKPVSNFFCFTEDRQNDIRLRNAIPARWTTRPANTRTLFTGTCAPGEFYTWQIGVFAPFVALENLTITSSVWVNEQGHKIKGETVRCFNSGGIDTNGRPFTKNIHVAQHEVQPLWIGVDMPTNASGTYKGKIQVKASGLPATEITAEVTVTGTPLLNNGDNDGWRKTRLRWLDSESGNADAPTAPYIPLKVQKQTISYLGGTIELAPSGFPKQITTFYDQNNQLSKESANAILSGEARFIIETASGTETLKPGQVKITRATDTQVSWKAEQKSSNFTVTCAGTFEFDGASDYRITVKARNNVAVKDIRLEVPYAAYAAKYLMGLGNKGGLRPATAINWNWDISKHQDKIWMGNVNAGLNITFKDENYVRPLVNIYYELGKLNLPTSWGNENKGGIKIATQDDNTVLLNAYSGQREMKEGDVLHYNFNMLITPVKPLNLYQQATERFYHSNSDLSQKYIPEALAAGANSINIHHKKDIYPYINYPYSDESVADLKKFIDEGHNKNLKTRLYYTTRELTVKIPELWALRSLGGEVIHDGPGKDARTLIHSNGPNEWLNKNLTTNFIPAWYNAFNEGKYKGEMDISVITTPDSRWNNYYLAGLEWMVKNLGLDGVYIDDSALDRKTLQRGRRILDADGKSRLIDIHSWNHNNKWAGYANSLHIYLDLIPYVDRTWIGEGFPAKNTLDFWFVEMSGIPFGVMSETLDARNMFRGMVFGMLPRLPWSGNPVPLWKVWDEFGMKDARLSGYWDDNCAARTGNDNLPATVYLNGDKALVVIANWTDMPQSGKIELNEKTLGFTPGKASLPEIRNMQWEKGFNFKQGFEVMGQGGLIILLEK